MKRPFGRAPRAGYRRGRCYITRPKTRPCGSHDATTFRGHTMSTRSLSALVSASCIFLLVACGKKEEAPPPGRRCRRRGAGRCDTDAEKVVNVYNWSDYIDPTECSTISRRKPASKSTTRSWTRTSCSRPSCVAGRTGYDVVVPSASFLARQIKAGVYQKLDKSQARQPQEPRSRHHQAPRSLRPGQRTRRELHVGHVGRRLQRGSDQRGAAERAGR